MTPLQDTFTIAMSDEFLDALMQVPKTQRKKVQKFIRMFRRNPTMPGFNYETIENSADPNMRSVRIDQSYRAILLAPKQGNVYVLLWVDNHDDAYDWAQRKRCVVHPETGSLQVFSVDETEYIEPSEVEDDEGPAPLFDEFRSRELRRLGVPDELLGVVRQFRSQQDLEDAAERLPDEVYEALFWLSEGDEFEAVHRAVVMHETPTVDTEDFAAALDNPQSQRRFVVVDDENLEQVLDASIEKWRVFLHPMQRKIVELNLDGKSGSIRVLGGAGTGKTVVAMHRAVYLAKEIFTDPRDRILFTTFTSNLAQDIEANLKKICDEETLKRIEIVHLDKWVGNFLRAQGYAKKIRYYGYGTELYDLWQEALTLKPEDIDLPASFYREEWEYVVQTQGCSTLRDYLRARRIGRGVALRRPQRQAIWQVFELYRNLLDERGLRERADAIRDARHLLEEKGSLLPYKSILLDEAQDMGEEAFKLIRAMIPASSNDLFIVGDGHQRIYRKPVVMKHCGINIQGRTHAYKLRINYRTTDEIRQFAVRLLENIDVDDLDGEVDNSDEYKSLIHGEAPIIKTADTFDEEVAHIVSFVRDLDEKKRKATCLVARTQELVDRYQSAMNANNIETYSISRDSFDDRSKGGLRIATMHRVKGLEFNNVIVAGVNAGTVPYQKHLDDTSDGAVREDLETRERALLYVAVTRARNTVLLTSHGTPSSFLE